MSYIPARAMHRAIPAEAHASTRPPVAPRASVFGRLSALASPSTWTAVAIAAGAIAAGVTAAALVDAD